MEPTRVLGGIRKALSVISLERNALCAESRARQVSVRNHRDTGALAVTVRRMFRQLRTLTCVTREGRASRTRSREITGGDSESHCSSCSWRNVSTLSSKNYSACTLRARRRAFMDGRLVRRRINVGARPMHRRIWRLDWIVRTGRVRRILGQLRFLRMVPVSFLVGHSDWGPAIAMPRAMSEFTSVSRCADAIGTGYFSPPRISVLSSSNPARRSRLAGRSRLRLIARCARGSLSGICRSLDRSRWLHSDGRGDMPL